MFEKLDEHISELSELIARTVNRRQLLARTVKGVFATAAGLTLAQFTNLKSAFAITCTCMWAGGSGNANCPHTSGCPGGINPPCPSGCVTCTTSSGCGSVCNYPGGSWVSCSGFGPCGMGYKVCTDCKCHSSCSYPNVCTCLSPIICYNCCTRKAVEDEMRRIGAVYAH